MKAYLRQSLMKTYVHRSTKRNEIPEKYVDSPTYEHRRKKYCIHDTAYVRNCSKCIGVFANAGLHYFSIARRPRSLCYCTFNDPGAVGNGGAMGGRGWKGAGERGLCWREVEVP